jgi:hypothetical protein
MNIETVISNFNRGRMYLNEIQWLIDTVEQLEEENGTMAEKHAEKDLAIRDLMQMNLQQKERIAQLENVKEMYLKANFVLLDQNDRLMKEVELYKLQETKLIAQLKMMKNNSRLNSFYKMSEENLRLAEENARLKDDKDLFSSLFIKQQLGE